VSREVTCSLTSLLPMMEFQPDDVSGCCLDLCDLNLSPQCDFVGTAMIRGGILDAVSQESIHDILLSISALDGTVLRSVVVQLSFTTIEQATARTRGKRTNAIITPLLVADIVMNKSIPQGHLLENLSCASSTSSTTPHIMVHRRCWAVEAF